MPHDSEEALLQRGLEIKSLRGKLTAIQHIDVKFRFDRAQIVFIKLESDRVCCTGLWKC